MGNIGRRLNLRKPPPLLVGHPQPSEAMRMVHTTEVR